MQNLSTFVRTERHRFVLGDGNIFVSSFAKVERRWVFLEIIRQRHKEVSAAFVANSRTFQATMKPGGPHDLTGEQIELQRQGWYLGNHVHLEIESFYLFAKIMLDEIAHAVENFFGPQRGIPLDSHDDFCKHLQRYAVAKGFAIPVGLEEMMLNLKQRISDFRDSQIAHEKSPRTTRGTTWGLDGNTMLASIRLYPKDMERQVNSESLDSLSATLHGYCDQLATLLQENNAMARFRLAQ